MTLRIPTKETIIIEPDTGAPTNTYTVQFGDTLYTIANKYKTTVKKIKELKETLDVQIKELNKELKNKAKETI